DLEVDFRSEGGVTFPSHGASAPNWTPGMAKAATIQYRNSGVGPSRSAVETSTPADWQHTLPAGHELRGRTPMDQQWHLEELNTIFHQMGELRADRQRHYTDEERRGAGSPYNRNGGCFGETRGIPEVIPRSSTGVDVAWTTICPDGREIARALRCFRKQQGKVGGGWTTSYASSSGCTARDPDQPGSQVDRMMQVAAVTLQVQRRCKELTVAGAPLATGGYD
ncbi:hypothetical protein BaRGS_00035019, partial [Batillaria attramentaria]